MTTRNGESSSSDSWTPERKNAWLMEARQAFMVGAFAHCEKLVREVLPHYDVTEQLGQVSAKLLLAQAMEGQEKCQEAIETRAEANRTLARLKGNGNLGLTIDKLDGWSEIQMKLAELQERQQKISEALSQSAHSLSQTRTGIDTLLSRNNRRCLDALLLDDAANGNHKNDNNGEASA